MGSVAVSARVNLFDTDVIIEYLRGRPEAARFLHNLPGEFCLSAVTVAELYAGVRDHERHGFERFLKAFRVVPLDTELARDGGLLKREYGRSHGTGLADAMIAATARHLDAFFYTFNLRHYPMLDRARTPWERV